MAAHPCVKNQSSDSVGNKSQEVGGYSQKPHPSYREVDIMEIDFIVSIQGQTDDKYVDHQGKKACGISPLGDELVPFIFLKCFS